ncbi:MAG: lipopolysaccharide biosynthesis protein [Acidobacteriota bacterium]
MTTGLSREAAASLGRYAAQAIAMALTVPILVRELGATDYGLWILAWSLFGLAGLLDFGFGTAAVKLIAEDSEPEERNARLSTVMAILLGLAALSLPGVLAVAELGVSLSKVGPERAPEIFAVMVLLGLRLVTFGLPGSFYRGVLYGGRQIVVLSAVQTAASVTLAAGIWVLATGGGGLVELASLNLTVMVVEHGAMAWLAHRRLPTLRLGWRRCRWREAPALFSFSFAFFLSGLAGAVLLRTDPIIVQVGGSLAAVAAYGLALKVVETVTGVIKQVTNLLGPRAARLADPNDLDGLLVLSTRLGAAAAVALAAPLAILAPALLTVWLGDVPEFTTGVLTVLALALLLSGAQLGASGVLAMSGAHRAIGRIAVTSACLNAALSVALVGPFGALGVAAATLAVTFLFDVIVVPTVAARKTGQSTLRLWRRTLGPIAAPATLWILGLTAVRLLSPAASLAALALGLCAVSVLTAAVAGPRVLRSGLIPIPATVAHRFRLQSYSTGETA